MPATWKLREPDPACVRALARDAAVPSLLASLLVSRGHAEREAAERHLRASPMGLHDPFLLPGMEAATERVRRAVEANETILIHGDYDVDGVTGTALLVRALELLGARVRWHIPNRLVDGYSFGAHSIERALAVGATLGISVDNGTSAHAVIDALAARGIDTVVTDHHEPPDGPLPRASAIVNPKLAGSRYPWRELCGGAVAFKLAWGLAQSVSGGRRADEPLKRFLEEATAYVAIATVCDVVPLLDENRVFARFGIKALERSRHPGLRALLAVAGLADRALDAEDVAFQVGPRINASGRLGSAERAVELLLAQDAARAGELARALDELNRERRRIEREVLAAARAEAERQLDRHAPPMLVLAGEGWHQGVVGIVAARLVEDFGLPAVVIGVERGLGRGSARTVPGFHVLEALAGAREHLLRFGGHAQAAGLELAPAALPAAREAIWERARALAAPSGGAGELWIDSELPFHEMTADLMRHLERLEPYGERNEKPVLLSRDLRLACEPRAVGEEGAHLLLQLRRGEHALKAMAFRMGPRQAELAMGAPIDAVYTPRWNRFRGETSLELVLHDFHVGGAAAVRA